LPQAGHHGRLHHRQYQKIGISAIQKTKKTFQHLEWLKRQTFDIIGTHYTKYLALSHLNKNIFLNGCRYRLLI